MSSSDWALTNADEENNTKIINNKATAERRVVFLSSISFIIFSNEGLFLATKVFL